MGDEFYSSLKLISGEEIFSLISIDENDGDPVIILQNPVIIKLISNLNGSYIKIKPWMEIPKDDFFIIKYDKIITMTEVSDKAIIEIYKNYIQEDDQIQIIPDDNETKITDKMGYLSSVEEARKNLENLFKDTKDRLDYPDQP